MLARLTYTNQLTLPDSVLSSFPGIERFDVKVHDGRIVLTPVSTSSAEHVRGKLAELGVTDADVADAVTWARRS